MDSPMPQPFPLLVAVVLLTCSSSGLRDVRLDLPPVVAVGSCVTLRCQYDLEGMPLYSVKWYRGNFEFFRVMPKEFPARQAFPYPDIHVELHESNEKQVTLCRVPMHMSGNFSCEVSTDVAFTTAFVSSQLQVVDTVRRPVVTVSKNLYDPGDVLEVNCTMPEVDSLPWHPPLTRVARPQGEAVPQPPPLKPLQLTPQQRAHLQETGVPPINFAFWINNTPVPKRLVQKTTSSSATLRRELTEQDFPENGEVHIKCVAKLAGLYRQPSHIVTVRRNEEPEQVPPVPEFDNDLDPGVEARSSQHHGNPSFEASGGATLFRPSDGRVRLVLGASLLLVMHRAVIQ